MLVGSYPFEDMADPTMSVNVSGSICDLRSAICSLSLLP